MGRYLELARKAERGPNDEADDTLADLTADPEPTARTVHQEPAPPVEPTPAPAPSVDAIIGMPLTVFATHHLALRIKLPDGSQCWFCSGANEVAALRSEGVDRGVIWTARELADVLGAGWTRATIATLIATKRAFDGTVTPSTPATGGPSPV